MAPSTIQIDGAAYAVARAFSDVRVLINYQDAWVFADRVDDTWNLSALGATGKTEADALDELIGTKDVSVVVVTPP